MGKRYVQHSDLCGCERCAIQADREHPSPVFDEIEDPNVCNGRGGEDGRCYCYDDFGDEPEDDDEFDDCGLMPDGQCAKAGSEECDWICGRLREDDGCCPGCGACPGFTGAECDETCEWATTGGGAA